MKKRKRGMSLMQFLSGPTKDTLSNKTGIMGVPPKNTPEPKKIKRTQSNPMSSKPKR